MKRYRIQIIERENYKACKYSQEHKLGGWCKWADVKEQAAEIERLEEAFNLCYDHLCDLHFAMKTCPKSYQAQILKEIEETAKTNPIFIEKKKEEEE